MAIHPAFIGHGTFTEFPDALLKRYNGWTPKSSIANRVLMALPLLNNFASSPGPGGLVGALQYMNIKSVWVYCFGRSGVIDQAVTGPLVDTLRTNNFKLAAWGYCSSKNVNDALAHANTIKNTYKIDAFIADVEPYNTADDDWAGKDTEFDNLIDGLVKTFGTPNLGISIAPPWLMLDSKKNQKSLVTKHLIQRAAPKISVLAPQVYWMDYPTTTPKVDHYGDTGYSDKQFPRHDPDAYARLCIQTWRDAAITLPIIISGQSYWDRKEGTPSQSVMEEKVRSFTKTFSSWTAKDFSDRNVVGMNWYHAGALDDNGAGSMSDAMIKTIAAAKLDARPYAAPANAALVA
jgi:hypothetical protein